jgi:hypothetical protein
MWRDPGGERIRCFDRLIAATAIFEPKNPE